MVDRWITEEQAARRVDWQLRVAESMVAQATERMHWNLAAPGSELAEDDALLSPFQLSHYVGHCLAVATDALQTVILLLRDADRGLRTNLAGQYPVLRAAVESAGLAAWILQPDDRPERLRRVMAARWEELGHDDRLAHAFADDEPGDERGDRALKARLLRENTKRQRERKTRLREASKRAGIREEDVRGGLPGYGRVLREAAQSMDIKGSYAHAAWHILSGLAHPSVTRSVGYSELEVLRTDGDVHQVRVTARMDVVALGLDAALTGYRAAIDLTAKRGGVPDLQWVPDPGFPLPPGYAWLQQAQAPSHAGAAFGLAPRG